MAGHSKWANIKHRKGRRDARRSKVWSKCSKAIIVAAKAGGGDPVTNLALRYAIDDAKAQNMPRDTIENAVKKGTGELAGVHYEGVIYEGYGPGGVAVMLEILTDNRNRTAPEIKRIFEHHGGNLGTSGCVAYIFHSKGQVFVAKAGADEDAVMAAALDAGAEDVIDEGESWQVVSPPEVFATLRDKMQDMGVTVESAQITMIPNTTVACSGPDAEKVLRLVEELDDHDDVQKVHANFDIPEQELAAME